MNKIIGLAMSAMGIALMIFNIVRFVKIIKQMDRETAYMKEEAEQLLRTVGGRDWDMIFIIRDNNHCL